jgi:molecular chaperone GrpE
MKTDRKQDPEDLPGVDESLDSTAEAPSADAPSGAAAETDGEDENDPAVLHDKWLRAVAEGKNIRKRAAADVAEARTYGGMAVINSLLPALDNLQRALTTPPEGLDEAFLEGLRLIEQQWVGVLTAHGVVPIPAEPGSPLDPTVHRALLEQPSDQEPGTIVAEIVRGYRLHDRLLRESQVVVAAAPATDSEPDKSSPESGD